MDRFGKLLFAFVLALGLVACTAAGGGAPGPDAGGKTDDIGDSECIPLTCQSDWCLQRSDGCGGILDCGSCGPGDDPGDEDPFDDEPGDDEPGDDEPGDDEPGGSCEDAGEPDSSSPRDLGEYEENFQNDTVFMDFPEPGGAIDGDESDNYTVRILDVNFDGNPKGGFAVRAPDSTEGLTVVVSVACDSGTIDVTGCDGGTLDDDNEQCVMTVPAGSSLETLDVTWNCTGFWQGDEDATLHAEISTDCDGDCGGSCQPYQMGLRVNDE